MDNYFQEVPKHKKKAKHKPPKKSDHKHQYYDVLIHEKKYVLGKMIDCYYLGEKCSICSAWETTQIFLSEKMENGYSRMMSNERILEKYKDLELIDCEVKL